MRDGNARDGGGERVEKAEDLSEWPMRVRLRKLPEKRIVRVYWSRARLVIPEEVSAG